MKKLLIWARVGVNLAATEEEISKLAQGDSKVLQHIISRGDFILTGESYIPGECVTSFNKENQTNYPERDIEFYGI